MYSIVDGLNARFMRDDDAKKQKHHSKKIQIWMQNPGIEPGSPEPQSGILTTVRILPMDKDILCNIKYCIQGTRYNNNMKKI